MEAALDYQGVLATVSLIMAEALDQDAIGSEEDFFASGGDSLMAVRALSIINAQYGIVLSLSDVLAAPTPSALAAVTLEQLAPQDG